MAGNKSEGELDFTVGSEVLQVAEETITIFGVALPIWSLILLSAVLVALLAFLIRFLRMRFGDPSNELDRYLGILQRRKKRAEDETIKLTEEEKEIVRSVENGGSARKNVKTVDSKNTTPSGSIPERPSVSEGAVETNTPSVQNDKNASAVVSESNTGFGALPVASSPPGSGNPPATGNIPPSVGGAIS